MRCITTDAVLASVQLNVKMPKVAVKVSKLGFMIRSRSCWYPVRARFHYDMEIGFSEIDSKVFRNRSLTLHSKIDET